MLLCPPVVAGGRSGGQHGTAPPLSCPFKGEPSAHLCHARAGGRPGRDARPRGRLRPSGTPSDRGRPEARPNAASHRSDQTFCPPLSPQGQGCRTLAPRGTCRDTRSMILSMIPAISRLARQRRRKSYGACPKGRAHFGFRSAPWPTTQPTKSRVTAARCVASLWSRKESSCAARSTGCSSATARSCWCAWREPRAPRRSCSRGRRCKSKLWANTGNTWLATAVGLR